MTINEITHKQATALAKFLHEMRGDWDTAGIEHAIGKARGMAPAVDLAVAAIKAAALASNRTPTVIGMEGAHWRGTEAKPRHDAPTRTELCSICSERRERCRQVWTGDHEFLSVAENLRNLHKRAIEQDQERAKGST